ncbi:MAG: SAM-dependent methyltransferase, partial [Nitrospira sp.]|nr:SAM-dependent methyltransferase [Nitrospira sp.]
FASAEGRNGGQFYTPNCIVRLLVEMLAPYKGRIFDPCCGSSGRFAQSEKCDASASVRTAEFSSISDGGGEFPHGGPEMRDYAK